MGAPALATLVVVALGAALLPGAAGAQELPGAAGAEEGCPPPPGESEIDQYVESLPAVCPAALGEAGVAPRRLPYTGLAVVALLMVGTLMVMAGLAIRRRRESGGGGGER